MLERARQLADEARESLLDAKCDTDTFRAVLALSHAVALLVVALEDARAEIEHIKRVTAPGN